MDMEFACHTWGFTDVTLPEALATIARLGFRCVDIGSGANFNAARAAENPRRMAAEIRADLDTFNLRVSDLYVLLPRISLADEPRRERELELFRALVPFAVALESPGITLSAGLAHPADDAAAFERTAAALRQMTAQGMDAGLRVSIEPHVDSMAQTPEAAQLLLEAVPGLEITLDWAQMICQSVPLEQAKTLLPRTRHMHIRQAKPGALQTPFEDGALELTAIVKAAQDAHYNGALCVELMLTSGWHGTQPVNVVRESLRLRAALKAARDAAAG
jgi:sugar phosphate isomerase/epimerase